jgi:hypothetical protein
VDGLGTASAKCWRTFGIAAIPILATVNTTPGANIGIEIEIMTTGASIEAHTTGPEVKTYVSSITLATKTAAQIRHIEEDFET